jgi:hypothetical protein
MAYFQAKTEKKAADDDILVDIQRSHLLSTAMPTFKMTT